MIKGVNKRIVEISLPQSELFEKALVFLRAEACGNDDVKAFGTDQLEEAARNALSEADIYGITQADGCPGYGSRAFPGRLVIFGAWAAALFRLLWRGAVIVCAVCLVRWAVMGG